MPVLDALGTLGGAAALVSEDADMIVMVARLSKDRKENLPSGSQPCFVRELSSQIVEEVVKEVTPALASSRRATCESQDKKVHTVHRDKHSIRLKPISGSGQGAMTKFQV